MIINKNSVLYNLPDGLVRKQLFVLDSIRFTTELVDLNYKNFEKELMNLSLFHGNSNYSKELIPVFNYCWSIIDNVQRFMKLYKLLPSNDNHNLINNLRIVTPLRNTFQHMDERIDECLLNYDVPFYGSLSWEINQGNNGLMSKFYAISGLFIPSIERDFRIEKKNLPLNILKDITLQTFIRKGKKPNFSFQKSEINMSQLFSDFTEIILKFENNLEEQFKKQNATLIDWRKRRDIVLNFKF